MPTITHYILLQIRQYVSEVVDNILCIKYYFLILHRFFYNFEFICCTKSVLMVFTEIGQNKRNESKKLTIFRDTTLLHGGVDVIISI